MTGGFNPAIPAAMAVIEAINTGNLELVDDAVTATFVDHDSPVPSPPGPVGYRHALAFVTQVLAIRYTVEEVFATDDRIVVRATAHGVCSERVHGPGSDGRPYAVPAIHVFATAGDRLAEHWGHGDELGVRRQAGARSAMRRLSTDGRGSARFEPWTPVLLPERPGPGELSASDPLSAAACMVVRAPAGGGHATQPDGGRRLVVMLSGECEVSASGHTVVARPGDLLLVEDTAGAGHSSWTSTGFDALMIVLD